MADEKSIHARIDAETFRLLKIELARSGITLQEFVRLAVADFLARRGDQAD